MPNIKYDKFWHGSRPAYYFRKAKHIASRPFYPLLRWKDYGHRDEGENDPAWEARLEAMKSLQSLPNISVTDIDLSCFPSVDQILSEAALRRESSSFSAESSSSWTTIAELEDTQVTLKLEPASQSMVDNPQPQFLPTTAELDDQISRWLDPKDPATPTVGFRKACPVANFHLSKMMRPKSDPEQLSCQSHVKARSALVESLTTDQTGDKMILNQKLQSTLAQLETWFGSDAYAHLLGLWPLCHGHLGAWCAGMNLYVHQPHLFVVKLPNRGGNRSRSGSRCHNRRIISLYGGGMMTRMGCRALGLCRARRFVRR